jgi:ubiquinone/menaquinone biosynthesis C-methylase UbiE
MNYENMLSLKSKIGKYDAGSLLDLAVGRGEFLKFALSSFRSWQSAAGIDTDPESLRTAKTEFAGSPVILVLGSALAMPFTDHYFDTITMSNAFASYREAAIIVQETERVSKEHGLIINEMLNENLPDIRDLHVVSPVSC